MPNTTFTFSRLELLLLQESMKGTVKSAHIVAHGIVDADVVIESDLKNAQKVVLLAEFLLAKLMTPVVCEGVVEQ